MANALFVAVGDSEYETGNSLAYSLDGQNWVGLGHAIFELGSCIAHNGGMWIAGGIAASGGSNLAYSYNGIDWTAISGCRIDHVNSIAHSHGMWIATGYGTDHVAYSYDGIHWTSGTRLFTNWGNDAQYNGSYWLATGYSFKIHRSTNGIDWSDVTEPLFNIVGYNFAWGEAKWVVGGGLSGGSNTLAYSSDGEDWTGLGKTIFSSAAYTVHYADSMFVAGGIGTNTIAHSLDGINWTGDGNVGDAIYGLTFKNGLWIAGGYSNNNSLWSSVDGINWTGLGNSVFEYSCYDVACSEAIALFVAVGARTADAENTLAYTLDGETWVGLGDDIFDTRCVCVAFNERMWLATGYSLSESPNTLAYSYDGIHWNGLGNDVFDWDARTVCWAEELQLWVAGGRGITDGEDIERNIAYSSDGINWTYETSTEGTYFNLYCSHIRWNGTYFLAVGNTCSWMYYSYDGMDWTEMPEAWGSVSPLTRPFYYIQNDMLWIGTKWLVSGQRSSSGYGLAENTLGYIGDIVSNWGGYGKTVFELVGYGFCTDGTTIVCCGGATVNLFAYSTDGVSWAGSGLTGVGRSYTVAYGTDSDGDPIWVAGGYGNVDRPYELAYSSDGMSWSSTGTSGIYLFDYVRWIAYGGPIASFEVEIASLFGPRVWMM